MKKIFLMSALATLVSSQAMANEITEEKEVQDMSDPLAVYTQAGFGVTNKGLNVKIGKTYDTGLDTKMGMNVIEIKGIAGEVAGWDSNSVRDDSIDSFRFRNFSVDMTNGRGSQIDVSYEVESETMDASYSFMQTLPKMGRVQFYPLAGIGVRVMNGDMVSNNANGLGYTIEDASGYSVPGTFGIVGTYSKIEVTDKIWLNYNPMWLTTVSGSDTFTDHGFAGESNILTHEFAASYQITPRANVRYFGNWNEHNNFGDGDHRVEFNYQF